MDATTSIWTTLIPLLSTLALLSRAPDFSWATCVPYMLPMLIPLLARLPSWSACVTFVRGGWTVFLTKPTLSFTSRLKMRLWDEEPNSLVRSFSTVLWEWNRLNKVTNCKHLLEESASSRYYEEPSTSNVLPFFVDDVANRFWNVERPDVLYTMWVERTTDREGMVYSEVLLKIDFMGSNANPNSVIDHLEMVGREAKRIGSERHRVQRVLVSKTRDVSEEGARGPAFMAYEFHTTSSFSNFFCEEAETVRSDLRHFLENKASYARTGRPWTYTVLNEGPPGVGKTKLVKAIAAMTGYTLIVINLAHIKSAQMLYEAFHTTTLAGETVPHNKRLYYIPEVDTQMFDALKARTNDAAGLVAGRNAAAVLAAVTAANAATATATATATGAAAANTVGGKPATVALPGFTEDKTPTLGEILNVLDGVPERHGHILILDTNHLADLDPALIRPGRVDRILSWRKLSSDSTRRFLENYYSVTIPKTVVFPDRLYSAAELQSLAALQESWETFGKGRSGRMGRSRRLTNAPPV